MTARMPAHRYARLLPALLLALAVANPSAQTKIMPEKNSYSVADDVKLGQEAAAEAKKQLPMLNDNRVDDFVEGVGAQLAAAIPGELRHAGFHYTFDVVNQREINAFALPGGPMFLNRGMIEAAKTETEMAGVMAHEIAHVALRHGTAQATKGQKFQIGAVAGQILGAIVGGAAGSVISQGSQFGLGAYFLKYGREYERQADLMGAQIMARAGYDPREMANMFKTIQAEGGRGGPEWLSSHPDPGNRYNAIVQEASMLRVEGNANSGQFQSIKSRLAGMSPAYTAEQIAKGQAKTGGRTVGTSGRRVVNVEPPSNSYRTHQPSDFVRVSVPANWDAVDASAGGVTYAPDGGFVQEGDNGGAAFTHGVQVGVAQGGGGNLQQDTQQLLQSFSRSNPDLRAAGNSRRETIGGRQGITTPLSNVSEVTGEREYITLSTTQLRDGSLLYIVGVAPQSEAKTYENAFRRVRQSLQIAD
jgi:Zn-dependent protease with chaperone function